MNMNTYFEWKERFEAAVGALLLLLIVLLLLFFAVAEATMPLVAATTNGPSIFLRAYCQTQSLSEAKLCSVWSNHLNSPDVSYHIVLFDICSNKRVTPRIIQSFIEYFPGAVRCIDSRGLTPLHVVLSNENCTLDIVRCFIEIYPDVLLLRDYEGCTPLFILCQNDVLDEAEAVEILRLFMAVRPRCAQFSAMGLLPIQVAVINHSPEFCRVLVVTFPESIIREDVSDVPLLVFVLQSPDIDDGVSNALLKTILENRPDMIRQFRWNTCSVLHLIARTIIPRSLELCRLLIDEFPELGLASQRDRNGDTPLLVACKCTTESNWRSALEVIKFLHDRCPEAIYTLDVDELDEAAAEVAAFLNLQLHYARIARDSELVTTPNEDGDLPIHCALYARVALGTIKLLLDANNSTLLIPTRNGNTLLHEACRLGDYGLIEMLLTRYPTEQVHTQNLLGELPIQVLIESNTNEPESAEHLSSIFLLLRASPAVLMSGTELGSE